MVTLVFYRAVLYRNVVLLIVAKAFVLQKTCFKVKALKMFKISSDSHIKMCQSLKRSVILKIPSNNADNVRGPIEFRRERQSLNCLLEVALALRQLNPIREKGP